MHRKNGYNFKPRKLDPMIYLIRDCKHKWYVLDDQEPDHDMITQVIDGCNSQILATFYHTNECEYWIGRELEKPLLPRDHFMSILELFYMNELVGREIMYDTFAQLGWLRTEMDDRFHELNGCVRPFGLNRPL